MKRLNALGMIAAATLFCAAPLSLHWSPAKSLSLSVDTADARWPAADTDECRWRQAALKEMT
jgi:hypothetical protein